MCGKVTTGRMPRLNGYHYGDGSFRYPRRHKGSDGKPCSGNIEEAEWVVVVGRTGQAVTAKEFVRAATKN